MTFTVRQTFETIGDSCAQTFTTREEAEQYADSLRADLAAMIADWEVEASFGLGNANEVEAWREVEADIEDGEPYGLAAGEYIAKRAVVVEETEEAEP